jgi:hypothetical protein
MSAFSTELIEKLRLQTRQGTPYEIRTVRVSPAKPS